MPGYSTRELMVDIGGHAYRIHALSDRQQYYDPGQVAERAGVPPAHWSLFGQVWPAGRILAEAMSRHDVAGMRILELGCGLGLSSLVLSRRKADITATDYHPLAGTFLQRNALQNQLPDVRFQHLDWLVPDPALGRFDLIIGSDILYERGHAQALAEVLDRHARPRAEILVTDPGRGHAGRFLRALAAQGFDVEQTRMGFDPADVPPFRGRLLRLQRDGATLRVGHAPLPQPPH